MIIYYYTRTYLSNTHATKRGGICGQGGARVRRRSFRVGVLERQDILEPARAKPPRVDKVAAQTGKQQNEHSDHGEHPRWIISRWHAAPLLHAARTVSALAASCAARRAASLATAGPLWL